MLSWVGKVVVVVGKRHSGGTYGVSNIKNGEKNQSVLDRRCLY